MINNLQISGIHSTVHSKEKRYVLQKIGKLDKYTPRSARESTFVDVKLKQIKSSDKECFEADVIIKLPKGIIMAKERATTLVAAIDEVEENLKHQLTKYKELHAESRKIRHFSSRFRRSAQSSSMPL